MKSEGSLAVIGAMPGWWGAFFPFHLLLLPERAVLAKGEKFFEKMSRVGTKNCAVQKHSAGGRHTGNRYSPRR